MGLDIVGTCIATVFAGLVLWLIKKFISKWELVKREEKNTRDMMAIKIECMIHALKNINQGLGQEFERAYDKRFDEIMEERNFIERQ